MSGRRSERDRRPSSGKGAAKPDKGGLYRILVTAGALILLLIVVTLTWPSASTPQSATAGAPVASADRVEVVYFHRTERCASCLWAEQASRWTVRTYLQDELAAGRVTFQAIDVQKPENTALARKYRAAGSSLFLNYVKDGQDHIVEAVDTYPYVGNEARFSERLVAKIKAGLEVEQ